MAGDGAFSADGAWLAYEVGGRNRAVHLVQTAGWTRTRTLSCGCTDVEDVTFSPDGSHVAARTSVGPLLWRVADGASVPIDGPDAGYWAVAWLGERLAIAQTGGIVLVDPQGGPVRSIALEAPGAVRELQATASRDNGGLVHDALVIGAGLSGLVATWRLRQACLDVRLLEARDFLGGRIRRAGAPPVEVGPSWVWDHERHVHALLRELGLSTFPHHQDGLDVYDDGDQLQRGRLPRSHVPERRVRGGTFAIIDALAARVGAVEAGHAARRVEVDGAGLRVTTDAGSWAASHVIVAVPPALAAHTLALPDLDAGDVGWLRAVPTWMEDVAKVVVRYPHRFWRDQGLSGRAFSRVGPLVEVHDLSGPDGDPAALFGFVPRPLYDAGWRDRVVAQLTRLFGPQAEAPAAMDATAWWTEPWTSVERAGPTDERRIGHPQLRAPRLEGRLHFVSTETSGIGPGHMEGAVERAEDVARIVAAR